MMRHHVRYYQWQLLVTGLILLACCSPGFPSSFRANGVGARARGIGGAYVAIADDTTASFWNPAGLAFTPCSFTQVEARSDSVSAWYTPPGGSRVQSEPLTLLIPTAGVIVPLHQRHFTSFGLLGYVPYGLQLDWPANAAYRYNSTMDKISVTGVGVATAYQAGPRVGLGAGFFMNGGNITLARAVPSTVYAGIAGLPDAAFRATGNDSSPNYDLGALWHASPRLRLGAAYHSSIDLTVIGHATLTVPGGPVISDQWRMPLHLPQSVSVGAAWQTSPVVLLAGQVDWVNWSTLHTQKITFLHGMLPDDTIPRLWHDSAQLRAGLEYTALHPVVLRAGYSYDTTPVPGTTLDPALIDLSRNIVSAGLGVARNHWGVDLAYEHFFGVARSTSNSINAFPTNGSYNGHVDVFTLTLSYR